MEGGILIFAQVMFIIVATFGGIIGISLLARIIWRLTGRVPGNQVVRSTHSADIERLQTAIDAIAIEVERISEAQRFTTTLLSNRLPNPTDDRSVERPLRGSGFEIETPK